MSLRLAIDATDGSARAGRLHTARGWFDTPCFMPVGTRGSVKALSSDDLEVVGAEVMLANTYHLMLRPGTDVVSSLGGIHRFASWDRHVLTDSGGFQVLSLSPEVDDGGVTFRSVYDGSFHRLTPEGAVAAQELIGADIQMVLDVCPPHSASVEVVRSAVDRTAEWAVRARGARRLEEQAMFGIVQGGLYVDLRSESARRTVEVGFDGYAVGGLSVGESRDEMLAVLAQTLAELPAAAPRYLMGVGDPCGMIEAVALGVDLFDCVLPTRLARHGSILTGSGRLSLRRAEHTADPGPLEAGCACPVCRRWSRGYLRHLLIVGEPSALRLLTIHNLWWTLDLVARARQAIIEGGFPAFRERVAEVWGSGGRRPGATVSLG